MLIGLYAKAMRTAVIVRDYAGIKAICERTLLPASIVTVSVRRS